VSTVRFRKQYTDRFGHAECWPSPEARLKGQKFYTSGIDAVGEQIESRFVTCAQCAMPIEDYSAVSTCPFCETDNILGKKFLR